MVVLMIVSCGHKPLPIRVGIVPWPGTEGLYLARDLGYLKPELVQLLDYPSDPEMIRAYRNGDLDAISITFDEALSLSETKADIRAVLVQDISNGGDAIVGKPGIKTLQDLKGHRIGLESNGLGAFELSRAFDQAKLSLKDVKLVSVFASEHERAIQEKRVDAVVTYEPLITKLESMGSHVLWDSSKIPGEVIDIIAMREDILSQRPDAVKNFSQGWFQALQYLQKNPQDAARRIAPHIGLSPQQFLKTLQKIRIPNALENQRILGKQDPTVLQSIKRLTQYLVSKDLLKSSVDPILLLDDRLVKMSD
jgi:NitT/TauT family transport system substrate-binding protein